MIWLLAAAGIVCLMLGLRLFLLRREITSLTQKIKEMKSHATYGARLYLDNNNKAMGELTAEVNNCIESYEKKLQHAAHMESQVQLSLSAISHDLRTPLTAVNGYMQLIQKAALSVPNTEHLTIVQNNLRVLSDLVENFYDVSRLETSDISLEMQRIDIVLWVQERFMGFYENFEKRGITVNIIGNETPLYINADATALNRVCNNIIQNLLRYAKSTTEIAFISGSNATEGNSVVLTFSNDTDAPLPEDLNLLFERFYTAELSRTHKNTGLGLYIVRKLVRAMGGDVWGEYTGNRFVLKIIL